MLGRRRADIGPASALDQRSYLLGGYLAIVFETFTLILILLRVTSHNILYKRLREWNTGLCVQLFCITFAPKTLDIVRTRLDIGTLDIISWIDTLPTGPLGIFHIAYKYVHKNEVGLLVV